MLTLIPISANREALKHLTQIGAVSRLSDQWTKEIIERFEWGSKINHNCSFALFSALHNSFLHIAEGTSRDYLTVEEFHNLLRNKCESYWQEVINRFVVQRISLVEILSIFYVLREAIIQILNEVSLSEYEFLKLLIAFFDWVQNYAAAMYENDRKFDHYSNQTKALAIHDLHAIVESVRSPVDLRPVFQLIVDRVRNSGIWPMCAIGITDREGQEIIVPAQSGFTDGYPHDIKFPAIGSATLETIRRKKPIAISDVSSDREFPVLQEAARAAGYRSILLLPLILDDFQGVVTFGSPEPHEFTDEEITLANAIAQQILIAIDNARYYEREKQRAEQLEKLNQLIAHQNRVLQSLTETHIALTKLVLDNAGLAQIIYSIRNLFNNPIAIEDENFQLLGYSEDRDQFDQHRKASIEAGGTPPEVFKNPEISAILENLRKNRRPILIPTIESIGIEKRRIVAPIVAGGDIMGYIWVMESSRPFEDYDFIKIEQAAQVLALEMMKQRVSFETEMRLKAEFMDDLLSEKVVEESELIQRASYLGFDLKCPATILVVDVDRYPGNRVGPGLSHKLGRQEVLCVQQVVAKHFHEIMIVQQSNRILVLISVRFDKKNLDQMLSKLAHDLHRSLHQIDSTINTIIGIGDLCYNIKEIQETYLHTCQVISLAKKNGWANETIKIADLSTYDLLLLFGENSELYDFTQKILSPLIRYDQKHKTNLIRTLDVYLSCERRLGVSARTLYIHVNTLRQRLRRIKDILRMDLDDPNVRLKLQFAINVYKASQKSNNKI